MAADTDKQLLVLVDEPIAGAGTVLRPDRVPAILVASQAQHIDCDGEMRLGAPTEYRRVISRTGKPVFRAFDDLCGGVSIVACGIVVAGVPILALVAVGLMIPFVVLDNDNVFLV